MTPNPRLSFLPTWTWQLLGVSAILLFLAAVLLCLLCLQSRRWKRFALALPLTVFCYVLLQGFLLLESGKSQRGRVAYAVRDCLLSVPPWLLIPGTVLLALAVALLVCGLIRFEREHVTPLSVKEAVDNLPTGICCYLPGGWIVLINRAMEALGQTAAGEVCSGEALCRILTEGTLSPDCSRVDTGEGPILLLPDGSARALTVQKLPWEDGELTALLAADVTEAYRKTLDLERQKERLFAANRQLASYNREIVDLTIQTEILAARVRLHDAMGEDLLRMKQILRHPEDSAGLGELRRRLRRNISFLREDTEVQAADEYDVLLRTAERLGVRTELNGALPQEDPLRRVIATGLHECLTNLLRHAHGDLLRLELREEDEQLTAVFSGNGDPPAGPVRETGGLHSLREMTEAVGGTMTVRTEPVFTVILTLPKEATPNAL